MDPSTSKEKLVERVLEHHGIKGQKWGVRRGDGGGGSPPAHDDHNKTAAISQVLKKHGTSPLSNHELRTFAERVQLEQNAHRLHGGGGGQGAAKKFINELLVEVGKGQLKRVANQAASKQVDALLKKN